MISFIAKQGLRFLSTARRYDTLDLSKEKITRLAKGVISTQLPLKSAWQIPNRIQVVLSDKQPDENAQAHYYAGGLPAQMQAVRKLEETSTGSVHYVTDGQMAKSIQSGHQGHVHPSEWTAEECSIPNLVKAVLRGLNLLPKIDPKDFKNYSYLHIPLSTNRLLHDPLHLLLYGKFALYGLAHAMKAKKNVSKRDHWLCECIAESLLYHKALSAKIKIEQGSPSFDGEFRVYWSSDEQRLAKKWATWKELRIPCAPLTQEEWTRTLLKPKKIHAFKVLGDGKFYPDAPLKISNYCNRHFPDQYIQREARVSELYLNKNTWCPIFVREILPNGSIQDVAIRSFFCSPGHNEVFIDDQPLWDEVPISGISSIWQWTIGKNELFSRLGKFLNDDEIKNYFENLVPLANLSNLHVTSWDSKIIRDKIYANIRVSQGGNFNSLVAEKDDLLNIQANLENFFIGKWTLLSVGTCSRKSHVSNVPEYLSLCEHREHPVGFLHGLSGVGYSFSATSLESLKRKPPI